MSINMFVSVYMSVCWGELVSKPIQQQRFSQALLYALLSIQLLTLVCRPTCSSALLVQLRFSHCDIRGRDRDVDREGLVVAAVVVWEAMACENGAGKLAREKIKTLKHNIMWQQHSEE